MDGREERSSLFPRTTLGRRIQALRRYRGSRVTLTIFAGLVAGCVSRANDGWVVDVEGCSKKPTIVSPPPLSDETPVVHANGRAYPITAALAWRYRDQQAVQVMFSTSELHCKDVEISTAGTVVRGHEGLTGRMIFAPVIVDASMDSIGMKRGVIAEEETWRVLDASFSRPLFGEWGFHPKMSSVDPARDAPIAGRRTKLRFSLQDLAHKRQERVHPAERWGGAIETEGCGVFDSPVAPVAQPLLDARVGDRRLVIRGATFRVQSGLPTLRLTSLPADCTRQSPGDVDIRVRSSGVEFDGQLFAAQGYLSRADVVPTLLPVIGDGPRFVAARHTVVINGYRSGAAQSKPSDDLDRRDVHRHVFLAGKVDAIVCNPID